MKTSEKIEALKREGIFGIGPRTRSSYALYLDYVNNFITSGGWRRHYGLTLSTGNRILRTLSNDRALNFKLHK